MRPRSAADLPALTRIDRSHPGDRKCQDILHRQPEGGDHWWIKVAVSGLSNRQVVSAIARAARVDPAEVGEAGGRDRSALAERWLSVKKDAVDHPKQLRNAGSQGKMRVLELREGRKPVTPESVVGVAWQLRLRGATADDGYLRAKAILDHTRRLGFPNYLSGPAGHAGHAKLGRLIAQGKHLPERAAANQSRRRLLAAYQTRLCNILIAQRCAQGLLGTAVAGDVVEVGCNRPPHQRAIEVVEDLAVAQPRIESWEAVALAPLFGNGMAMAAEAAAAVEMNILHEEGVEPQAFAKLYGGRRAYRARPASSLVDIEGGDLSLRCELPTSTYVDVLLAEFMPAMDTSDD